MPRLRIRFLLMVWLALRGSAAFAVQQSSSVEGAPAAASQVVQTPTEALAQDAAEYAAQYQVTLNEAVRRLWVQQDSVAITDGLRAAYRDRLAGIFIEHVPAYRLVVLLTGPDPVPDQTFMVDGMALPILFRTGAPATRDALLAAIERHQAEIRAALPSPPGLGVDPRSGTLIVMMQAQDVEIRGAAGWAETLGRIAGVPVQIRSSDDVTRNLHLEGGGQVVGTDLVTRRRYTCTTGFVVTDGSRTAIATAAHCADALDYVDRAGNRTALNMVGAWGARYQDIQIHVGGDPIEPLFHADAAGKVSRPVMSWRNRESTRAGDFVCHRGERSGYSCSEVVFVDYAPPGDLCAGPCPPLWVAVRGPGCGGGDSGGPVFSGTIAFGIVKGASYTAGACRLYYYMSTDYLPPGWSLLHR